MKPYQINAEHALAAEGNFPNGPRRIPGWILDKIAVEKETAGYSAKKNPVCPECRVRVSNSGACFCL
jgi:tRNA(Ile2) C34 agmatinyltransferase TiaS